MSEQGFDNPLDGLIADDTSSTETETSTAPVPTAPEGQGSPDVDSSTSAVQPEGQGQPDAQTGLFDEYLSTVPEEHRSSVEQYLKDAERNVNGKLQEAAELGKSWEPFQTIDLGEGYEPVSLQEVGAENVGALLKFAQDISSEDPEVARGAFMALAEAAGVDLGMVPENDVAEALGADEEDMPPWARELRDRVDARERAEAEAEAKRQEDARIADLRQQAEVGYRAEYAEVEKENGKPLDTAPGSAPDGSEMSEQQFVIHLAKRFQLDHDEPIKAAYKLMKSISGRAEANLVNGQPTPPAPAERDGRASSAVQPVDSFEEAERLHKERNASAYA